MEQKEIDQIVSQCTRFLAYHYRQTAQQELQNLADYAGPDLAADRYGQGEVIHEFEKQVAGLLGKEQAVFMPSGTMCQQIALRIYAERSRTPHVAFHPRCHLEIHEQKGYQVLHGLHGVLVGAPESLITLEDLQQVHEPLAALLLELPQREIGGWLPAWEDLSAQIAWARLRSIPVHMDGARLWECQPFYGRTCAEIAAPFNTVYVSFYKILGGIAGSILAGPTDFIAEARIWQRRHGGNLIRLYPYVLSARRGLELRLGRMEAYHHKALEVAEILASFPRIEVTPNPPHTNMMHLYLRGDRPRLVEAAMDIARRTRTLLFSALFSSPLPGWHKLELTVGDATLDLPGEEIRLLWQELFELAGE
jgi:threonine aldolase